jgi:hypothetical protein
VNQTVVEEIVARQTFGVAGFGHQPHELKRASPSFSTNQAKLRKFIFSSSILLVEFYFWLRNF